MAKNREAYEEGTQENTDQSPVDCSVSAGRTRCQNAQDDRQKIAGEHAERFLASVTEDIGRTLYELRVQQLELEKQIEELHRIQIALALARERSLDICDLAPISHCTVGEAGHLQTRSRG